MLLTHLKIRLVKALRQAMSVVVVIGRENTIIDVMVDVSAASAENVESEEIAAMANVLGVVVTATEDLTEDLTDLASASADATADLAITAAEDRVGLEASLASQWTLAH